MVRTAAGCIVVLALSISACGGNQQTAGGQEVDDFAARIKQATPAPQPSGEPVPQEAASAATENGANPEGSDSKSGEAEASLCGAPKVAPFYGRKADQLTQDAVMAAVAPQSDVRFVESGVDVPTDKASKRLNIMMDPNGIIREARCG